MVTPTELTRSASSDTVAGLAAAFAPVTIGAVIGILAVIAAKDPTLVIIAGRLMAVITAMLVIALTYQKWGKTTAEEMELAEIGADLDGYGDHFDFGFTPD